MNLPPDGCEGESPSAALIELRECFNRTPSALRVLVVEDNTASQSVVATIIERLGGRADIVANGCEALKALSVTPYDLVLMDCQMPEMDGLETTRRMRRGESGVLNPQVPVVALTAGTTEEDHDLCLAAGMNDYLRKPFALAELANALERWGSYSRDPSALRSPISGANGGSAASERKSVTQATQGTCDPTVFDSAELIRRLLGDTKLAREVVNRFLTDIPTVVDQTLLAISQANFSRTRVLAHQIKGAAATVGGCALQRVACELESVAKPEQFETLALQLQAASSTLSKVLADWVAPKPERNSNKETP
jgi:CheY-like chemotaxis protein/HPt (histidine-containing phosphotransfer) domain-containing protein